MALILRLNTQEQLLKKGIDATGTPLDQIGGPYAFSTVAIKKEKGQEADYVTLKDTGAFYNSFRVFLDANSDFQITANSIKDGVDLFDRWGEQVLGLTEENLSIFRADVLPKVIELTRQKLKLAA